MIQTAPNATGTLLSRLFDLFDAHDVPYCVLKGYAGYPNDVSSDVDLLIERRYIERNLADLLLANEAVLDARLVQWFDEEGHFLALVGDEMDAVLPLHVEPDCSVRDRLVFTGEEILRTRRRQGAFWIPAPDVEFAVVLATRLAKRDVRREHTSQLELLWNSDPTGCREQLRRLLSASLAGLVEHAATTGNWHRFLESLEMLRSDLLHRLAVARPRPLARHWLERLVRRGVQWLRPTSGLHVVFLGPDGVGKSTVIDELVPRISPAFLHGATYQTFARSLVRQDPAATPHQKPPRSFGASLLKAGWWALYYTGGYFISSYRGKAAGKLVVNHRYLLDALVDPRRYRYSGPMWLLNWIWAISPKPDLVVVLDAPASVIQARKQEVSPDETARQLERYRDLAAALPLARIVDASRTPDDSVRDAARTLVDHLHARVRRQVQRR